MDFFNLLAHFFLKFSDPIVFIPFVIFGYFFNRPVFVGAFYLLFFTMGVNTFVKSYSHLFFNNFYPSGHMSTTLVFYGWIAWHLKNQWINWILTIVLGGIAFGLLYCDYHTWPNLFCSCILSIFILIFYNFLINALKAHPPIIGFLLGSLSFLLISLFPLTFHNTRLIVAVKEATAILLGGAIGLAFVDGALDLSQKKWTLYTISLVLIGVFTFLKWPILSFGCAAMFIIFCERALRKF